MPETRPKPDDPIVTYVLQPAKDLLPGVRCLVGEAIPQIDLFWAEMAQIVYIHYVTGPSVTAQQLRYIADNKG